VGQLANFHLAGNHLQALISLFGHPYLLLTAIAGIRAEHGFYRHYNRDIAVTTEQSKIDDHSGTHAGQQYYAFGHRHAQGDIVGQGLWIWLAGVLLVDSLHQFAIEIVQTHTRVYVRRNQIAAQARQQPLRDLKDNVHALAGIQGGDGLVRLHHLILLYVGASYDAGERCC